MTELMRCIEAARGCAGLFRLGRDVEAALLMMEVFETVQPLLAGVDAERQACWAQLLAAMLKCQESQDWLGLADWMEYELVELLEASQQSRTG